MAWIVDAVKSSIGKKFLMGAMGLLLCLYLAVHLAGNMIFFGGRELFNAYAHALESIPVLPAIEIALASVFLVHIVLGLITWFENRGARGRPYAVSQGKGERSLANTTMIYSGAVTAAFLVIHVLNLRFAQRGELGLYGATVELFSRRGYSLFYIVCVCVLGTHVWHGFQSALRTVGLSHPKYTPAIEWISRLFGVAVGAGFSSIPLWVLFVLEGQA